MTQEFIEFKGIKVYSSPYISDYETIPWKIRLFSWPWKPWVSQKYSPKSFTLLENKLMLVSYQTFEKLKNERILD